MTGQDGLTLLVGFMLGLIILEAIDHATDHAITRWLERRGL